MTHFRPSSVAFCFISKEVVGLSYGTIYVNYPLSKAKGIGNRFFQREDFPDSVKSCLLSTAGE